MRFLQLLPLLLCFTAMGQVSLIIEDETGSGFKLGINGYAQNREPVKELVIHKLDTFPFEVRVELAPQAFFTKQMHFQEKGNYSYVITTNSRDELQLRYRGKTSSIPATIPAMDVQHKTPLRPLASVSQIKTKTRPVAVDEKPEEKPVENAALEPVAATTVEDKIAAPAPTKKPAGTVSAPQTEPAPPAVQTFEAFMNELKATEFEFEKLNKSQEFAKKHQYTTGELKQIFRAMKYDNTRLALLREIQAELTNMTGLDSLRDSFEYEISKQTFDNMMTP